MSEFPKHEMFSVFLKSASSAVRARLFHARRKVRVRAREDEEEATTSGTRGKVLN